MSLVPLICPRCGAPLPLASGALVTCGFCDATIRLDGHHVKATETKPASVADSWPERRVRFIEALKAALATGQPPYGALCVAARYELGPLGETDGLARITLALAADFDQEHGTTTRQDPLALSRIAEAYHLACGQLATAPRAELNLQFLQATRAGPVHLRREVTAASLAELAARAPGTAQAPKKRGWWPFG